MLNTKYFYIAAFIVFVIQKLGTHYNNMHTHNFKWVNCRNVAIISREVKMRI